MESDDKSSSQPFEENSILNLQEMSAENQRQVDAADSLINNSAIQAIVDKFNIDNFAKNHPLADDIENGVKELIKENNKLKDTLKSNNDSKNRHFSILEKWLEDAQTSHKNYKRKLDEAHNTIEELKAENIELKKPLQEMIRSVEKEFLTEKMNLRMENTQLRDRISVFKRQLQGYEQTVHPAASEKDSEIYKLFKKLEESERERRKLTLERDRLLGQEMKVQQILSGGDTRNVTNLCYWNHRESLLKDNLKEFDKILQSEENTFSQANPKPDQSSSSVVDDTKEEISVEQMKAEISALRKQVLNERAVCTLCRKLFSEARSKFGIIHQLSLAVLKDHDSKMKALEISLVKAQNDIDVTSLRHELSDKQNRIIQLESDLTLMRAKLDEANKRTEHYYILQSQMKVYEEDFHSMRTTKDSLANDKLMLEHNLRSLSQENAKLKKKLRASGESELNNLTFVNPPYQYICINDTCQKSFASEEELQTHIYSCLNLKD
ncbi:hypothetical protein V9T40_004961 [Parthenolecanium corni]|uniref:NF-kappa-B essential modulator NEMO N-terminal domain-containing protein n=1 Tax=Parthenolecanium corni TaxID=536013 RepID=A0AAN9Y3S5_9HEMI